MFVFICRFAVQLPTYQSTTTNVSDNNKQYRYISVLLLWSQIVLVCCFSGNYQYKELYVWRFLGKVTADW